MCHPLLVVPSIALWLATLGKTNKPLNRSNTCLEVIFANSFLLFTSSFKGFGSVMGEETLEQQEDGSRFGGGLEQANETTLPGGATQVVSVQLLLVCEALKGRRAVQNRHRCVNRNRIQRHFICAT